MKGIAWVLDAPAPGASPTRNTAAIRALSHTLAHTHAGICATCCPCFPLAAVAQRLNVANYSLVLGALLLAYVVQSTFAAVFYQRYSSKLENGDYDQSANDVGSGFQTGSDGSVVEDGLKIFAPEACFFLVIAIAAFVLLICVRKRYALPSPCCGCPGLNCCSIFGDCLARYAIVWVEFCLVRFVCPETHARMCVCVFIMHMGVLSLHCGRVPAARSRRTILSTSPLSLPLPSCPLRSVAPLHSLFCTWCVVAQMARHVLGFKDCCTGDVSVFLNSHTV